MSPAPLTFRVAQAVGFTGAAWLSGNIAALSMNTVPGLLESRRENEISSATLVKQWKKGFEAGKAQNPPIAAVTATAFFYLACIVPYTIAAMRKTNAALVTKATVDSRAAEKANGEIDDLVREWISLNSIRSLLPLVGGAVGIFATLF